MLKFKKHFAKVVARAATAIENNEKNEEVYKSLLMELFRKNNNNKIRLDKRKNTLSILLISSWSSGKVLTGII